MAVRRWQKGGDPLKKCVASSHAEHRKSDTDRLPELTAVHPETGDSERHASLRESSFASSNTPRSYWGASPTWVESGITLGAFEQI